MSFFGKNVKKIRGVKKMSQQNFADLFDLKRATLGAYEEGRSEPKIDTIIKVANYFSISIDDILTKEITINQLLSFDVGITTDKNKLIETDFAKIPFVNHLNKSFFIDNFLKTKTYNNLPSITLPVPKRKDVLAFLVEDLTMVVNQEGIYKGDVVIAEQVLIEEAKKGDPLVILANQDLFLRRLGRSDTHYLFYADHVNVEPIMVSLEAEVYVWRVKDVILKRYPSFMSNVERKIDDLLNKLNH